MQGTERRYACHRLWKLLRVTCRVSCSPFGIHVYCPGTLLLPELGGYVLLHYGHLIQRSNSLCLILHLVVFFEVFDIFRMDQIFFLRILVVVSYVC